MKKKLKRSIIQVGVGLLFWLVAWFLSSALFKQGSYFSEKILLGILVLFFVSIGMLFILGPIEATKVGKIISIPFGWLFLSIGWLFEFSQVLFIPLFSIMALIALQIGLWEVVSGFYAFNQRIDLVSAYSISLITLLLFAYKGKEIIQLFFSVLNGRTLNRGIDRLKEKWIHKALEIAFFRRRAYEFSILIMIIASIEKFMEIPFFDNMYWINFSKVSFEVLITYVAIDTYIQTFLKKG